jgi:hypothetical protein
MTRRDEEREKRLAEALRENLRRRKAQARGEWSELLPGMGRGTAGTAVEGGERSARGGAGPLHHPAAGPPTRSGED